MVAALLEPADRIQRQQQQVNNVNPLGHSPFPVSRSPSLSSEFLMQMFKEARMYVYGVMTYVVMCMYVRQGDV